MATHLLEFPLMNICYEYFDLYEPTYYMYGFEFCNLMAFLMIAIGYCHNSLSFALG
jgi:hypothetical protein